MAVEVTMNVDQFTTAHVVGKDAKGHVETLAVAPTWTVSDSLVTVVPSEDGLSCRISATVPTTVLGTSVVTVHYTPTSGPALTAELTVTLVAAPVVSLELTVDAPQDLP